MLPLSPVSTSTSQLTGSYWLSNQPGISSHPANLETRYSSPPACTNMAQVYRNKPENISPHLEHIAIRQFPRSIAYIQPTKSFIVSPVESMSAKVCGQKGFIQMNVLNNTRTVESQAFKNDILIESNSFPLNPIRFISYWRISNWGTL